MISHIVVLALVLVLVLVFVLVARRLSAARLLCAREALPAWELFVVMAFVPLAAVRERLQTRKRHHMV